MTARTAQVDLDGPDDTVGLGRRLGGLLRAGDLVVLTGDLGAGKTTLARGIGVALSTRGALTSPTFVLARRHPSTAGGPDVVHADLYRLPAGADLDDLDLADPDAVTLVEWGSGRVEHLAPHRLEVTLTETPEGGRRALVTGVGSRWADDPGWASLTAQPR